jgi:hypothetical protein
MQETIVYIEANSTSEAYDKVATLDDPPNNKWQTQKILDNTFCNIFEVQNPNSTAKIIGIPTNNHSGYLAYQTMEVSNDS